MKKIVIISFALIYSFALQSEELLFTSDLWCPYVCEPSSKNPGFMVEITKNIFEKAGYQFNFKIVNWARAISDTRDGKFTGIIGASRADAPDFIVPETAIGYNSNFVWSHKLNSWAYQNAEGLKGKKIGVINSYSYNDEIDLAVKNKNSSFSVISGDDALMKMVKMTKSNRLDGFIENPFVLKFLLKDKTEFREHFIPISQNITKDTNLFVAFPPKNPKASELAKILSTGMDELRKNGKLKTILTKYGLVDWK
jgi:polar amino acid transport system substrate-binding protein